MVILMVRPAHDAWYGTSRWKKRRAAQLRDHPLCAMCLEKGIVTAATVADHVEPHRGDQFSFWFGVLQSLCAHHHNSAKQEKELRGYSTEIGVDGWPVDKDHPANKV
jgi:5-methylcytosine-specific restriction endonuclease McrA